MCEVVLGSNTRLAYNELRSKYLAGPLGHGDGPLVGLGVSSRVGSQDIDLLVTSEAEVEAVGTTLPKRLHQVRVRVIEVGRLAADVAALAPVALPPRQGLGPDSTVFAGPVTGRVTAVARGLDGHVYVVGSSHAMAGGGAAAASAAVQSDAGALLTLAPGAAQLAAGPALTDSALCLVHGQAQQAPNGPQRRLDVGDVVGRRNRRDVWNLHAPGQWTPEPKAKVISTHVLVKVHYRGQVSWLRHQRLLRGIGPHLYGPADSGALVIATGDVGAAMLVAGSECGTWSVATPLSRVFAAHDLRTN